MSFATKIIIARKETTSTQASCFWKILECCLNMRDLTNGLAASNANLRFALGEIATTDLKYYAASFVGEELNSLESDQLPDRIAFRPVAA